MSISSVIGTMPFIISFAFFYMVSFKVAFKQIPSLFEFTVPSINYKELGLEHDDDELISQHRSDSSVSAENASFNNAVHHVFSFNLAIVFLVIELSLFEIEDYFNSDSRLMIWHLVIPTMAMLLVYVIPMMIVVILLTRYLPNWNNTKFVMMMMVVILISWLYFLSELDFITGIDTDDLQHDVISKYVSELTLLGITAIAMLGGVGTISNPFYELLKKKAKVTKFDIDKIVMNLKTTNQILKLRQDEIANHQRQGYDVNNKEMKLLEEEINAILQLKTSINNDLINSTNLFDIDKNDDKLSYKISKLIKKLFSVYCLYRLISLFLIKLPKMFFHKIFHEQDITQDALAVTITKIIIQLNPSYQIEEDALVNQLSFILSGSLFLCSISSVVNTFHSISKFIPHSIKHRHHHTNFATSNNNNNKRTSILRSLLISELLGMYTLATIILLRSNLPTALSSNFDSAIGGEPLQVKFVENWFDKVSIATCFVTIIGIAIEEFLSNGGGEYDDDDFYLDEERFVQNDKFA